MKHFTKEADSKQV